MNYQHLAEKYRVCLWKTKRLLEDIPFDDTIDHYVLSEKKYILLVNRINQCIGVKSKGAELDE